MSRPCGAVKWEFHSVENDVNGAHISIDVLDDATRFAKGAVESNRYTISYDSNHLKMTVFQCRQPGSKLPVYLGLIFSPKPVPSMWQRNHLDRLVGPLIESIQHLLREVRLLHSPNDDRGHLIMHFRSLYILTVWRAWKVLPEEIEHSTFWRPLEVSSKQLSNIVVILKTSL